MSDNLVDFSLFVRREFPTRFFARGDAIFREGEQADEFFADFFQPAIAAPDLDLSTHERDRRQCP